MKLTRVENESVGINREKSDSDSVIEMKPYPSEHSCRLNEPGKYVKFARKNGYITVDGKKIDVIFGITKDGKSEIQAYRYPKSNWEAAVARSHCNAHDGFFEAAKGISSDMVPSLEEKAISLHTKGFENAKKCIKAGDVNTTDKLKFSEEDRQKMLGEKGDDWGNYALHHLGVDINKPADTRMAYTHPILKDGKVYKKALDAHAKDKNEDVAKCAKALGDMCHDQE
jgi:hypothetical protein